MLTVGFFRSVVVVCLLAAMGIPLLVRELIGLWISLGLCVTAGLAYLVLWIIERQEKKREAMRRNTTFWI